MMQNLLLAFSALLSLGDPVADAPRIAVELVPAITRAEIEAHVRFLAADERKGRFTGSPEAELCARYMAEVFARQGLAPAGDDGTYLQRVPLSKTSWSAAPELALTPTGGETSAFAYGRDFDGGNGYPAALDLALVVASSEADLPKADLARTALFFDGSTTQRKRAFEAAGLGAGESLGLLLVPGFDESPARPATVPRGRLELASRARSESVRPVRVHGAALKKLRQSGGARLAFDPHVTREEVGASNVAAKLVGVGTPEQPELASEAIVVTAHYDHLDGHHARGGPGVDTIWNGADDDASGCAAVLEIAGALAHEKPPARTIIFLLVTGEEIGLLGTDHYLDAPIVPLERTVLNLNFEMIGRPDDKIGGSGKLWLTGYDLSSLGAACAAAKIAVLADPYPNEHFFERSDNIAFVRRGVVGQTLSSYNLHKDYHQPSDEADTLDYVHMEACTRAGLEALKLVSSGALRPAWIAGKEPKRR
ncbi:MAG: M28 family peptidase [Planctomycetes bacterium]|nr:M28 family peptidase [Planctomycetota bacterium]